MGTFKALFRFQILVSFHSLVSFPRVIWTSSLKFHSLAKVLGFQMWGLDSCDVMYENKTSKNTSANDYLNNATYDCRILLEVNQSKKKKKKKKIFERMQMRLGMWRSERNYKA